MNEKINLVDILKDCPQGTKLYSTVFGEVKFERIDTILSHPIVVRIGRLEDDHTETFAADGRLYSYHNGECALFPSREQRDWGKFELECLKAADAEPNLASLWHDVSEEPRYEEFLLAEESNEFNVYKLSGQEDNNSWELLVSAMGIIRWAYISDLQPKQFGNSEQLKRDDNNKIAQL